MRRAITGIALTLAVGAPFAYLHPASAGGSAPLANSTVEAPGGAYTIASNIPVTVVMKGGKASLVDLRSASNGQIVVTDPDLGALSFQETSLTGPCASGSGGDLQGKTRTNVGTGTAALTCDVPGRNGTVRFLVLYGYVQENCVTITSRSITMPAGSCDAVVYAFPPGARSGTLVSPQVTADFDVTITTSMP